ncbi:YrhA family protein, partial [Pseudolactococcus yaeyamensis]
MFKWEQQLKKVHEFQREFGDELSKPISEEEFDRLKKRVKKYLDKVVPDEYKIFMTITNGVGFDGVGLYEDDEGNRLSDLVENNLDWYTNDELRKYLILGDGNISWYVYFPDEKKYQILD